MSSANKKIPSVEEMKTMIQGELFELIKVHFDEKTWIRFGELEEKNSSSILPTTSSEVLNVFVYIKFNQEKEEQYSFDVRFWRKSRNSTFMSTSQDYKIRASLKNFAKLAAKVVVNYFCKKGFFYVGTIRFDLIPTEEHGQYEMPNLILSDDNLYLYKTKLDANLSHQEYNEKNSNRIPYMEFVQARIEDYMALAEHKERLKQAQNHKESS